jgi:hypothetical protein
MPTTRSASQERAASIESQPTPVRISRARRGVQLGLVSRRRGDGRGRSSTKSVRRDWRKTRSSWLPERAPDDRRTFAALVLELGGPALGTKRPRVQPAARCAYSVEKSGSVVHIAAVRHCRGRRLLLGHLGHHGFGGDEQARNRRRILQRQANDLGRIDNSAIMMPAHRKAALVFRIVGALPCCPDIEISRPRCHWPRGCGNLPRRPSLS